MTACKDPHCRNKLERGVLSYTYSLKNPVATCSYTLSHRNPVSRVATFHFWVSDILIPDSYINAKLTVCKDKLPIAGSRQKLGQIWTLVYLFYTIFRKNPVATKGHHLNFVMQMP